ncbi:MAG: HNH/ENDO VII family nuclease [Deltaproteobacteria bacterium]|nr:HNH/ENDO VII family nuclease [Deltaproteobacteria bacterium]
MLELVAREALKGLNKNVSSMPIESLKNKIPDFKSGSSRISARGVNDNGKLQESQKENIGRESPYSQTINDDIKTTDELKVYKEEAKLKEQKIDNKECLVRDDIDRDQTDELGKTNYERMEKGKPPLDKNSNPFELHHIGQKENGHFAELTKEEHRGIGNDTILHDKSKETEINRNEFQKQKSDHWKKRAEDFKQMEA